MIGSSQEPLRKRNTHDTNIALELDRLLDSQWSRNAGRFDRHELGRIGARRAWREPRSHRERRQRVVADIRGGIAGGTYWQLLSMTKKGDTPKESSAPPDRSSCKNGEWASCTTAARARPGPSQMVGNRVVMKYEDGELYGNYRITRTGSMMELDDGEYVLRLRYAKSSGC